MSCLSVTYANCIEFTVQGLAQLKALGYTSTNLQDLILEFLTKKGGNFSQVDDLKGMVEGLSAATLPAGARTFGLHDGSVDASKIENRQLQYSLIGKNFEYDLSGVVNSLPQDISYLSARVDVVDNAGTKRSALGKNNLIELPSLPASVEVSMNVRGTGGQFTLNRKLYLTGDSEKSIPLNVSGLTTSSGDLSIQENLELLNAKVAQHEQRLASE